MLQLASMNRNQPAKRTLGDSLCSGALTLLASCHSGEPFDLSISGNLGDENRRRIAVRDAGQLEAEAMSSPSEQVEGDWRAPEVAGNGAQVEGDRRGPVRPDEPLGPSCAEALDCATGYCVNPMCCNRACASNCESCAASGECSVRPECTSTPQDAGISVPTGPALGTECTHDEQCASGFCVDGVCCEQACAGACQQCGADGLCNVVPPSDKECSPFVCPVGPLCRQYVPPLVGNCSGLGRCATPDDCVLQNLRAHEPCGERLKCNGKGLCISEELEIGSRGAECFQTGGFDNVPQRCVNPETTNEIARGSGITTTQNFLQVELSPFAFEIGMFGFDAANNAIATCALVLSEPGTYVTPPGSCNDAVSWTLYGNE